MASVLQAGVE
ncbi:hypothetical protein LINGRAPRIM_LOCUS1507 [Linum grandiflorum]